MLRPVISQERICFQKFFIFISKKFITGFEYLELLIRSSQPGETRRTEPASNLPLPGHHWAHSRYVRAGDTHQRDSMRTKGTHHHKRATGKEPGDFRQETAPNETGDRDSL